MMINMQSKYGKRIFSQQIGTEVGSQVFNNYKETKEKTILDFQGVQSVNTAFFNALISYILKNDKQIEPSAYFAIKDANETVQGALAISVQLMKYQED